MFNKYKSYILVTAVCACTLFVRSTLCYSATFDRQQVVNATVPYLNINWAASIDEATIYWLTDDGLVEADGTQPYKSVFKKNNNYVPMAYVCGGYQYEPVTFKNAVENGTCAGGYETSSYGDWDWREPQLDGTTAASHYLAGIDCAAFVNRCLSIGPGQGIPGLIKKCLRLRNYSEMSKSDFFIMQNGSEPGESHIMLLDYWVIKNENAFVYESTPPNVGNNNKDDAQLNRLYNNIKTPRYSPYSIFPQFEKSLIDGAISTYVKNYYPFIQLDIYASRLLEPSQLTIEFGESGQALELISAETAASQFDPEKNLLNVYDYYPCQRTIGTQIQKGLTIRYKWPTNKTKLKTNTQYAFRVKAINKVEILSGSAVKNDYEDTYDLKFYVADKINLISGMPLPPPQKSAIRVEQTGDKAYKIFMSADYYKSTTLPENKRIIFPVETKANVVDTLITAYALGKLNKVGSEETIQLTLLPDATHLGSNGYYWLQTNRTLSPGDYQFIATANSDYYFPDGDTLNITVTEDSTAPAYGYEIHANVYYTNALNEEKPLPPGTRVAVAQYFQHPYFERSMYDVWEPLQWQIPSAVIGWKRVEQIQGYGIVSGSDGYVNIPINLEYLPKDNNSPFIRIIAFSMSYDQEFTATGRIKGYVIEKKQVPGSLLDYFKCLSGLQQFSESAAGSKIFLPGGGRVVIEHNANLPIEVEGWATTNGQVDPCEDDFSQVPLHFINENTSLDILSAITKGYDFAKSINPETVGKNIRSVKCVWRRNGDDLSGGETKIDTDGNMYVNPSTGNDARA